MTENQKKFIERNGKILNEIFSEKLSELLKEVLDNPDNRDKNIDAINVLRNWLREIKIIESKLEAKGNSFI